MFTPHTPEDKKAMLEKIGVSSIEELLSVIPDNLRIKAELNLPKPLSELEVIKHISALAQRNINHNDFVSFLGGGVYDHYIPSVINHLLLRSEFYTAYTPYQPEVSQGTLQAIYEYQSLICALFEMEVSNAGMYDGASALAEACHMARTITKKNKVIIAQTIHPYYKQVIRTYTKGLDIPIVEVAMDSQKGIIDPKSLSQALCQETAAVLIQHPNFLGNLESVHELSEITHKHNALFIVCVDPISLGLLPAPGNYNADIAVAEGQALGIPQSFGGPFLGILTCRKDFIRTLPGRIVGKTTDVNGKTGYVLVLQTREQHIRREKATSNICTNEALCALAATIYLSIMGKTGIKEVSRQCYAKSHYLANEISKLKGFSLAYSAPFFKEFVIRTPVEANKIIAELKEQKVFAGIDLSQFNEQWQNQMLVCVTEKRTKSELEQYVRLLKEIYD
ncbi:MAG: aminomethyl-transferring glycine dehydrogenase subunit GcvPA [candidate division WOR-3 bacterium]|nr:aminomethyl-transferring glycine dehydrogenase subunit GcvPA [candidate division WOR-3 bacterium]